MKKRRNIIGDAACHHKTTLKQHKKNLCDKSMMQHKESREKMDSLNSMGWEMT